MRSWISITMLFLAGIFMLGHNVIPHHHHGNDEHGTFCFAHHDKDQATCDHPQPCDHSHDSGVDFTFCDHPSDIFTFPGINHHICKVFECAPGEFEAISFNYNSNFEEVISWLIPAWHPPICHAPCISVAAERGPPSFEI